MTLEDIPPIPAKVKNALLILFAVLVVLVDSVSWFMSMAGDLVLVGLLWLVTKLRETKA